MPLIQDEDELQEAMSGGGSHLPILRLTEDRNTVLVRFMDEPTAWAYVDIYYDQKNERSVMVVDGERAPRGAKVKRQYFANVLDTENDSVRVVVMPKSLAERLYQRYQKRETITDRDYELARIGSGLKTKYQESPEAPAKRAMRKYEQHRLDLEEILDLMFGAPPEEEDADDYEEDEDDYEEEEEKPRRAVKRPAKRATKTATKKVAKKVAKKTPRRRPRR